MTLPSSALIIIIVIAFAAYLIYNQNQTQQRMMYYPMASQAQLAAQSYQSQQSQIPKLKSKQEPCQKCEQNNLATPPNSQQPNQSPSVTNITIDGDGDPYSDAIKKQDLYTMYDPLTYPQLRLPREVLDRYNEYYERTGTYPAFNQATQPYLFDNPILNGILIKICEENEPFSNNVPNSVPLFRVRSAKNANRYFYYILDQRYLSKIEPKIPLDHVRVNGIYYPNADFYGIPELFDGDVIENISIFPGANFRVSLYKSYHFP